MVSEVEKMAGRKWGRWWLDVTNPVSFNFPLPWDDYYWIRLSKCRDVKERRLWLEHMVAKRYINKRDLIDLCHAFDDLVSAGILKY